MLNWLWFKKTKPEIPLKAFLGKPNLQAEILTRIRVHRVANQIRQGLSARWQNGLGSAVGCTVHGDLALYPSELGIPYKLAGLEDCIFEGLPPTHALILPERFIESITPGDILEQVPNQLILYALEDPEIGVIKYTHSPRKRAKIHELAELFRNNCPPGKDWNKVLTMAKELDDKAQKKKDRSHHWHSNHHSGHSADADHAWAWSSAAAALRSAAVSGHSLGDHSAWAAAEVIRDLAKAAHHALHHDHNHTADTDRDAVYVAFSLKLCELLKTNPARVR